MASTRVCPNSCDDFSVSHHEPWHYSQQRGHSQVRVWDHVVRDQRPEKGKNSSSFLSPSQAPRKIRESLKWGTECSCGQNRDPPLQKPFWFHIKKFQYIITSLKWQAPHSPIPPMGFKSLPLTHNLFTSFSKNHYPYVCLFNQFPKRRVGAMFTLHPTT